MHWIYLCTCYLTTWFTSLFAKREGLYRRSVQPHYHFLSNLTTAKIIRMLELSKHFSDIFILVAFTIVFWTSWNALYLSNRLSARDCTWGNTEFSSNTLERCLFPGDFPSKSGVTFSYSQSYKRILAQPTRFVQVCAPKARGLASDATWCYVGLQWDQHKIGTEQIFLS